MLPVHDLHYGKYADETDTGSDYDREEAEQRAKKAVRHVLEQAVRSARIEQIHTVCDTSDFLHVDRDGPPATTEGTPQDLDGTIAEVIAGGQALAVQLLELMRSVAPVKVHFCPGNHDRVSSQWMHSFLKAHFSNAQDVRFSEDRRTRQYWMYGVTRGCFFHGDVRKRQLKQIGNVIAREHGFGEYTMAICGHKHFRKADDKSGLSSCTRRLPSADPTAGTTGTSTPAFPGCRDSSWTGRRDRSVARRGSRDPYPNTIIRNIITKSSTMPRYLSLSGAGMSTPKNTFNVCSRF